MAKDLNRPSRKEDTQLISKHMESCSASSVIRGKKSQPQDSLKTTEMAIGTIFLFIHHEKRE